MEGLTYDKSIIRLTRQIFIVNAKCVKTVQIAAVEMVFTPFLLRFNYILYCGMVSVGANCGKTWHLKDNNYECKNNICLLCGYLQFLYGGRIAAGQVCKVGVGTGVRDFRK